MTTTMQHPAIDFYSSATASTALTAHTPADYDAAITALMQTGITGDAYKLILSTLQAAREKAIKKLK